jgi:succinyl-diaminopimelate desuccinylase
MKPLTDPVKLAKKLVSISSVSGDEKQATRFVFEYLKKAGLKPKYQQVAPGRANVYVRGKGELLLNGHIDTVPAGDSKLWHYNPLGEVTKTKLYGRGSCDTKGSIACAMVALAKSPKSGANFSVTVGEENTFIGIKNLMKLRKSVFKHLKYCINFEPTEARLVTAHKGQITFIIRVRGKAAHASVPKEGDNAIMKLGLALKKIDVYIKNLEKKKHKLLGSPTMSVGVVQGGTMSNVVPESAELSVDRRLVPGENLKKVVREFREILKPLEVETATEYQAVELDRSTGFIKRMQKTLKVNKMNSSLIGVIFTTEFSEMVNHSLQGVVFGAGSVKQAHQADEFVLLKELRLVERVLSDAINSD